MAEATVIIPTKKSKLIYKSLLPDMKSDKHHRITFSEERGKLILKIKTNKLNHLKSIISSYISMVNLLEGLE